MPRVGLYPALMNDVPPGQFQTELSDGLRVDRLPVGVARGLWRVRFIVTILPTASDQPRLFPDVAEQFSTDVAVVPLGGRPVGCQGASGGGDELEVYYEIPKGTCSGVRVTYRANGGETIGEVINFSG